MVWIESILQDIRYGLRSMRRTPLVTAVAILSLALGIGANTAIFSVLDGFLLRMLPVKNAREIVLLSWSPRNSSNATGAIGPNHSFTFPMFDRFRRSTALSGAAGFAFFDRHRVIAGGRTDFALGEAVSGNYHSVLGVVPVVGRALTDDDDRDSAAPVCVVSYRFWESRFGRDPAAVGQQVIVGNVPVTIVGVEPKEFLGLTPGYAAEFRIPFHVMPQITRNGIRRSIFLDPKLDWVQIAARVPRGNESQARAEINVLLEQSLPSDQPGGVVRFGRGGEGFDVISRQFRSPLLVLMAAVGLILLIACANIANLLLARAQAREKETSMRLALGAGASRVIRQFLTESLLLAAAGGTLGIILAYRAGDLLAHGLSDLTFDVHPGLSVLQFTGAITLLTGILFGLAPAIRAARVDIQPGLQRDPRSSNLRLSNLLLVAQLALSLVAVVGAGLYVRTLRNLRIADLGMNTQSLVVFRLVPAASGYDTARSTEFAQRVLERLSGMPGVKSVALVRGLPLQGSA